DRRPFGPAARRRTDAGLEREGDDARGDRARCDPERARAARRQRGRCGGRARRQPVGAVSQNGEVRIVSARRRRRLSFQNRVLVSVLVTAAPAWVIAGALLWAWDVSFGVRMTLFAAVTLFVIGGAVAVQRFIVNPLRSLANMLEALREDDYSLRGRNVNPEDAVGEVMIEVNALGKVLQNQRFHALEAGVLLQKVITEVDIAVFAFDAQRRLRVINRAGEALLGGCAVDVIGRRDQELNLADLLEGPSGRIVTQAFPGGSGRW